MSKAGSIVVSGEGQMRIVDIHRGYFFDHLAKLDALFASLQHRAFRGKLTAEQAERELAEVG
jgi:hypothetical protein